MDRCAVDWKSLEELIKDRKDSDSDIPCLFNVGSCSLHAVQGAWSIEHLQPELVPQVGN